MKRTLSLILSLLMVLSLFSGLSITAADIGDAVPDAELADTGADAELAGTGTVITNVNIKMPELKAGETISYSPILPAGVKMYTGNDGGTIQNGVRWRDQTLDKPLKPGESFIAGHYYYAAFYLIADKANGYTFYENLSEEDFTLNGSKKASQVFHATDLPQDVLQCVFRIVCQPTVIDEIDFQIAAPYPGQKASTDVNFPAGLKFNFESEDEEKYNNYWRDETANKSMESTDTFVEGHLYRRHFWFTADIYHGYLIADPLSEDAITINGTVKAQDVDRWKDYSSEADCISCDFYMTCEKTKQYDLWLGSTRVTDENKNNILNDNGSAKFDPDTNTLTLDGSTIKGEYDNCKIYADMPLTIKGTYHLTDVETDTGVRANGALDLAGTFTLRGKSFGVYGTDGVTISSGSLYASGEEAAIMSNTTITFDAGASWIDANSSNAPVLAFDAILLGGTQKIILPYQGVVGDFPHEEGMLTILNSDKKTVPERVFIASNRTVTFNTNGHGVSMRVSVPYGGTVKKPKDPIDEGWTFGGWYTDRACTKEYDFSQKVYKNFTLFAKWTETPSTPCVVSFDTNGRGKTPPSQTVAYGAKAKRPIMQIVPGWNLRGWYTEKECINPYNFDTPVTENLSLYAKWARNTKKIGDSDGDDDVSILDATNIQRWIADIKVKDLFDFASDTDGDLELTILDATYIQRYLAGMSCPKVIGTVIVH